MNEELIPPAIPGEDTKEIKHNKRTIIIRLLPNGFQERKLRRLADTSAKLLMRLTMRGGNNSSTEEKWDLKGTYDKYYGKYRGELGSANTQQVI